MPPEDLPRRRGAVAVVQRDCRLLLIQRSLTVRAPGAHCFPGGGIERGETEEEALVREFQEELGAPLRPMRRIWHSVTPWNVELYWWQAELDASAVLVANPAEVANFGWYTPSEMAALATLLESNRRFLAALECGELTLDELPPRDETASHRRGK